jgi:hypothetical protein
MTIEKMRESGFVTSAAPNHLPASSRRDVFRKHNYDIMELCNYENL